MGEYTVLLHLIFWWTARLLSKAAMSEGSNFSITFINTYFKFFLKNYSHLQFSSVQSLSCVRLFVTPWIAACQASLSITNSQSSLRLKSIESVMPSSHLILWRPLLLLPAIFPSIRVFSSESFLYIRWPKYWSFSFRYLLSLLILVKKKKENVVKDHEDQLFILQMRKARNQMTWLRS